VTPVSSNDTIAQAGRTTVGFNGVWSGSNAAVLKEVMNDIDFDGLTTTITVAVLGL
jgi:hypothetical protein